MRVRNRSIALVLAVVFFTTLSSGAFATKSKMTEEELGIYADNNILFYDPYGSCVSSYEEGGVLGGDPDGTQLGFIKRYHDIAVMHSINYGIPWETVMARGFWNRRPGHRILRAKGIISLGLVRLIAIRTMRFLIQHQRRGGKAITKTSP